MSTPSVNFAPWLVVLVLLLIPPDARAQRVLTEGVAPTDNEMARVFELTPVTHQLQELPLGRAMEGFEQERAFWLKWRGGTSLSP